MKTLTIHCAGDYVCHDLIIFVKVVLYFNRSYKL